MTYYKLVLSPSSNSAVGTTEYLTLSFHLKKEQSVSKCYSFKQNAGTIEIFKTSIKLPELPPEKLRLSNTSGVNMLFPSLDRNHYSDIKKNASDFATRKEPFSTSCYN
jgi:hypothetical protein